MKPSRMLRLQRRGLFVGAVVLSLSSAHLVRGGSPVKYSLADLKALQEAFVGLADQVRPSVVAIRTYERSPNATMVLTPAGQGSGFIIDADGYVATNRHVLEDSDSVQVILLDGSQHEAKVMQVDRRSDLAVLKIEASGLTPVRFGDAAQLRVNQWVFACGNPFGLANDNGNTSVTFGVASATRRQMTRRLVGDSEVEYYGSMIETSATINPGNSGGPLFNIDGEAVGVVTAIETSSGVSEGHGYAIPIDEYTKRALETLKSGQVMRYGFLGVTVHDVLSSRTSTLSADAPHRKGAEVQSVSVPNGPAAGAGLQPKDIVLEYNGTPVEDSDHFVRMVGFTPAGSRVSLTYMRGGVKKTAEVVLGDRFELLSAGGPTERAESNSGRR